MPTYFYQLVSQFFEYIIIAIQDQKITIREGAVEALRAALVVTAQRETGKQKVNWYVMWTLFLKEKFILKYMK